MKLGLTILVIVLARASASAEPAGAIDTTIGPSPHDVIQSAFDRMFNYPSVRSVALRIHRDGNRVNYRSFDVVYKRVDGRGRTLLRFTQPGYLRGNALLLLEEPDGRTDTWIYQRAERRARRVQAGQHRVECYPTGHRLRPRYAC